MRASQFGQTSVTAPKQRFASIGEVEGFRGWTVAVTADRRAEEQIELLGRQGATIIHAPVIRTMPLGPDAGLRALTSELIADPPDVLIAMTGIGVRGWFATCDAWGLSPDLRTALASRTYIVARGPKAASAIANEGLQTGWRAPEATSTEVLRYLESLPLDGSRVAVQLAGAPDPDFSHALRARGARVVELPVYEWVLPGASAATMRFVDALVNGEVDAVTFTCAHAVTNLLSLAGDRQSAVLERLRSSVVTGCVGPVTEAAALRAGATQVVTAAPARLGAMVRALGRHFEARRRVLVLAGIGVVAQGAALSVAGQHVALTRGERLLFETLLDADGAVLSKARLARVAWDGEVDDHAVEVAVNRLRRKLGRAASAIETSNRRGYRLTVADDRTRGIVHGADHRP